MTAGLTNGLVSRPDLGLYVTSDKNRWIQNETVGYLGIMQSPTDDLDGTTQNLGAKLDFSHVKMTETAKISKAWAFFFFKGNCQRASDDAVHGLTALRYGHAPWC